MAPLGKCFVHFLGGSRNEATAVREVLDERGTLQEGLLLDGPDVELLVGRCEPEVGQYVDGHTEVTVGDQVLTPFKRVQVCPYKDTFEYSYDRMLFDYIEPYFNTQQKANFSTGLDFSHKGRRFNVVAVDPKDSYGVVGKSTTVFFEDHIDRKVLDSILLLPYEAGLPEKYRPTRLSLDEEGLLRDYLKPYFEQRSAVVKRSEVIEINGVKFKVMSASPDPGDAGAGVGNDTKITCKGVALREAFGAQGSARGKAGAKSKAKAAPSPGAARGGPDGGAQGGGQCTVS